MVLKEQPGVSRAAPGGAVAGGFEVRTYTRASKKPPAA